MNRPETSYADISTSDKSEALISLLDEYIDNIESQLKEVKEANDKLVVQNLLQFGEIDKLKKPYKFPNDGTKCLINDIISWELDLSQYKSLETILRDRYDIQKRKK